jgi:hypothetical protein
MRILIANSWFYLGGSETYAVTVGEQLERLGHSVVLFAGGAIPEGRELAASRGLTLTTGDLAELPVDDVDAAISQDAASAYALASERELPQLFVSHGVAPFVHPPQGLRPAPPLVVLNDRIGARAAALAAQPEVVRLRQPIDLERFRPRGSARRKARRVLLFSNHVEGDRLEMLESACEDLGLELWSMGGRSTTSIVPQERIAEADIVVGYGRSILEAMAMGRAAYVWDRAGGDGWVTPASYPALESEGFSGAATEAIVDGDRLREDFSSYRPELGTLGYDLVRKHHSAARHAEELVRLLAPAAAPAADPVNETLGLLVRAQARAGDDTHRAEVELRAKAGEVEALRAKAGEVEGLRAKAAEVEALCAEVDAVRSELARSQAATEAERRSRRHVEELLREILLSSSWRLTAPLRRLRQALRAPEREP